MKSSDKIEMTINICGELITLHAEFDDQNNVRDAERAVKSYMERLKTKMPQNSDRNLLAFTAYQFAKSYHQLLKIQQETVDMAKTKAKQIDEFLALNEPKSVPEI